MRERDRLKQQLGDFVRDMVDGVQQPIVEVEPFADTACTHRHRDPQGFCPPRSVQPLNDPHARLSTRPV